MGVLHLFCGKMASGKSTLAARIAADQDALALSEDALLASLYPGEVVDVATYARCSGRIERAFRTHLVELLRQGTTLALDFPANTRDRRDWLTGLAREAGVEHRLHHLVCSDERCLERMARRAADDPERRATDTLAMFTAMSRHFEDPDPVERLDIMIHRQDEEAPS